MCPSLVHAGAEMVCEGLARAACAEPVRAARISQEMPKRSQLYEGGHLAPIIYVYNVRVLFCRRRRTGCHCIPRVGIFMCIRKQIAMAPIYLVATLQLSRTEFRAR